MYILVVEILAEAIRRAGCIQFRGTVGGVGLSQELLSIRSIPRGCLRCEGRDDSGFQGLAGRLMWIGYQAVSACSTAFFLFGMAFFCIDFAAEAEAFFGTVAVPVVASSDGAASFFFFCHSSKLHCGQPSSQGFLPPVIIFIWLSPCFSQVLLVATMVPDGGSGNEKVQFG